MVIKPKNINLAPAHLLPLVFFCLISLWGALIYFFYAFNNIGVIIALTLAIVSFIIILRLNNIHNKTKKHPPAIARSEGDWRAGESNGTKLKIRLFDVLCVMCYVLCVIFCFYILFTHQTTQAIISPWQVVPWYFFIIYGLATALLIIIILKPFRQTLCPMPYALILISLHYFLSFSIALIIYKIGFGFDPFVHQATVDLIDKTGAVFPKPFYYLGQYSLEIIIHKITALPLNWIDRLLVPLAASLYLPAVLWQALKKLFPNKQASMLVSLLVLILPFSFFIATTPQSFAYFLLLLVVLLGLKCDNIFDLTLIYIFSLTALSFQPIAGIPALLFSLALTIFHSNRPKKAKKYFYALIFAISSVVLPLIFYFVEKNNYGSEEISANGTSNALFNIQSPIIPDQENFILNFIYLYAFNLKFIIAGLAIIGLWFAWKYREHCKIFSIYILLSASLGLSYLFSKLLPFSFLISYERDNYSERILLMAAFFLLPFILTAFYALFDKIIKQSNGVKIPLIIFSVIVLTTSLYVSYPRFDRYYNSRGLSTGQNDIDAARWIEENTNEDYIALANQQVSAAALREFGFKKYYHNASPLSRDAAGAGEGKGGGAIFYYPVPTGGPLYQYYLDMVYKNPSRETMNAAMDLVGVKKSYFILNKYWRAFPKILEEAKLEADGWKDFGDGEVYVFEYKR